MSSPLPLLEQTRARLRQALEAADLLTTAVTVSARPLSPAEAIGSPQRQDFPLQAGRERMIEARVGAARGQAFTDTPQAFAGTLAEVLALPLESNATRGIYVATLNAALAALGRVTATRHCRDDDPERCGAEIARTLHAAHGAVTVGLIGLNPAIAAALVDVFGAVRVRCTDLCAEQIGTWLEGVEIWDGGERTAELIAAVDVALITGTTLVNGTLDGILAAVDHHARPYHLFGVTAAGTATLLDLPRICPCARPA